MSRNAARLRDVMNRVTGDLQAIKEISEGIELMAEEPYTEQLEEWASK